MPLLGALTILAGSSDFDQRRANDIRHAAQIHNSIQFVYFEDGPADDLQNLKGKLRIMPTPVRALPPVIDALRYLARARQFRRAAIMHVDIENGEPFWPKWFLVTHALELAIKAYIVSREDLGLPAPTTKPANHDLVGLYEKAILWGLNRNPVVMSGLPHLSELHQSHYARYPQDRVIPAALIAQFDDLTDQLLADVTKAVGPWCIEAYGSEAVKTPDKCFTKQTGRGTSSSVQSSRH